MVEGILYPILTTNENTGPSYDGHSGISSHWIDGDHGPRCEDYRNHDDSNRPNAGIIAQIWVTVNS